MVSTMRWTMKIVVLASVLAAQFLAQERTFRSNVEIVAVPCTVVDAHGVSVANLTKNDFRVYDNDVQRIVQNLWIDEDLPVTFGVIIDASESQQDQFKEHIRTAGAVLERLLRHGDRVFVVTIDQDVRLSVDLTDMTADISEHLGGGAGDLFGDPCPMRKSNIPGLGPWSTCGSSPIWNAVYSASRIKLQPLTGNKALLVMTDGFDSGSTYTWRQAADAVNRANASLYGIHYTSTLGGGFAPDFYQLLLETGGTRFLPPDGDYQQIVSRIQTDLRHRYVLGFRPEQLSGKVRHELRIEVTRPGLSIRARRTYFRDSQ
jgi:VWFA-related protein